MKSLKCNIIPERFHYAMTGQPMFSVSDIEHFLQKVFELGGAIYELEEGSLGCGNFFVEIPGHKTYLVKEIAISSWVSLHTITAYRETPSSLWDAHDAYMNQLMVS